MSRRLTTTIGHRVVRVKTTRAKHRQGHFVTLAIVAAIGIAAGTILILAIDRNMSGEAETSAVEKRHVVSSIAGRIAAYPLPEQPDPVTEEDISAKQGVSAAIASVPQQVAKSHLTGAKKRPRLADTAIVTSSTVSPQPTSVSLLLRQPASERFGGVVPAGKAGRFPTQVETASNGESKLDAVNDGSGTSGQAPVDVAETETAALEIERKLAALSSEHFEPADDPVIPVPVADADEPLSKRRVKKFVNLRSGPDNSAQVLAIVPPNALVLAQNNCVHWCRAVYKGRKGYIYRALIRRPKKIPKTAQASASKPVVAVSQKRPGKIGR